MTLIKTLGLLLFSLFLIQCQSTSKKQSSLLSQKQVAKDPALQELENSFFNDLWDTYPTWASSVGKKDYDNRLQIPDEAYFKKQKDFFKKYKKLFSALDITKYPTLVRMDVQMVLNFIESAEWELNVFKSYQWDPSGYNVGSSFAAVLESSLRGENDKLLAVSEKLKAVPAYYEAAYKNIINPTKEHLELSIRQNAGIPDYFEKDIKPRLVMSTLAPDQKTLFTERYQAATAAVTEYVEKLKKLKDTLAKKNAFRSFRIGKKLYAEKFKFDIQAELPASEVYKRALSVKKQTHQEMAARAKELWPKYFPNEKPPKKPLVLIKRVLAEVAKNHIQPVEFLPTIKKDVPQLWDFIVKKDLLTLDPKKPLKVRETPIYQRGFAGASVDAPGPFDQGRETYYNVTPLDDMTPEKQQSYLREYNNYTLHILNIHEALPGHYAQLVYSNQNPSLVKKIFGNGAMIEGWAVYAERMMLEEGYGNNDPELWLMYYKWRLRVVSNTLLDYSIHNLDFSKKQAMNLLVNEAFQESAEADEKWNRATYSQVQLASYFTGFTEIYSLREELRLKMNGKFKLKNFHEKFLSYGSAPVKMVRSEMLKEVQ